MHADQCRTVGRPLRWGVLGNEPTPPAVQDPGPFYHGTKADLKPGDVLRPGYRSNFGERRTANYVYQVEPTGLIEDDPNLTDKKFPGNPTRSYRTRQALRVVGEIVDWEPHNPQRRGHRGARDSCSDIDPH